MLVTLVGSAPSSLLSARFMWVDLQLEASSETARINVIQWQRSSAQRKVCLCAGYMHTSPAFVTVVTVDRPTDRPLSGSRAAPQPLLSGEHSRWSGLRYCWLMSLILPAFFLNALLLPSLSSPLRSSPPPPLLYLSLSQHTHTSPLPPPLHMTWCRQDLQ